MYLEEGPALIEQPDDQPRDVEDPEAESTTPDPVAAEPDVEPEEMPAPPPSGDEADDDLLGLDRRESIQAALVSAGEEITAMRLAQVVGAEGPGEVRRLVGEINARHDEAGRAFAIREVAGGFQIVTRSAFGRSLRKLHASRNETRLSPAALETLAVVAYRQPVLRAEVEEIRGVQSGEILRALMEKGLVRIMGRDESLGRPLLYGTTKIFLRHFGLRNLNDLPQAKLLRMPIGGRPEPPLSDEPTETAPDGSSQERPPV